MATATFVIYSHSDNMDLWPYLNETLHKLPASYKKFIAVNSDATTDCLSFDKIIRYTDSDQYSQKLLYILDQIDTQYMVLIHDNDLVIEFDCTLFDNLLNVCASNTIDRCMFGVVARSASESLVVADTHFIGQMNHLRSPHFFLPYDVSPSLWKVDSYKQALRAIPPTSYRAIESSAIVSFCIHHLKMYGFLSNPYKPAKYVIGRPFYPHFQFLHIFCSRQRLEPHLYMDQQEAYEKIIERFPEIARRGVASGQDHINVHYRTV